MAQFSMEISRPTGSVPRENQHRLRLIIWACRRKTGTAIAGKSVRWPDFCSGCQKRTPASQGGGERSGRILKGTTWEEECRAGCSGLGGGVPRNNLKLASDGF